MMTRAIGVKRSAAVGENSCAPCGRIKSGSFET